MSNEVSTNGTNGNAERVEYVTPPVDIVESEQALTITADLPGVAPGSVDVSIDGDQLTLVGHVSEDSKQPRAYRRRFALRDPARFDTEHVSAVLKHGVLELRLPRAEKAKPRQIAVTVN